ncbi:F0F1 ATP synthase subunit C [uncultured Campylobacter sp.]|uniref:F0F1 ATP synthase subunit C n=1 Tax=uncultured Campylobacter sp. TaxID=218934 RepID=UPI002625CF76|nr:F0F1 ATP synthase subunit C [uncultured Campylobacter sp.]
MKRVILFVLALSAFAFAGDIESSEMLATYTTLASYSFIAAAFVLGVPALGGALAMGNTSAAVISGIARNPGVGSRLTTTMFISLAMIEAQVIYGLVIALLLLYANPLITKTIGAVVA